MKICVLGNSHAASLKKGWDLLGASFPAFRLTFFAARSRGLSELEYNEGSLVPTTDKLRRSIAYTSGGLEFVGLGDYDAYLVYGLRLNLPALDARLSRAVVERTCQDIAASAVITQLARLVRRGTTAPIYLGHCPQPAAGGKAAPEASSLLAYRTVLPVLARSMDVADTTLLPQPQSTLSDNGWNTQGHFATGSTRLDVGDRISDTPHEAEELEHMNQDFGRLWLESFLGRLHQS